MPSSDTGLRRVSVHWGAAVLDVALPAGVPVAVLIPSVVDILKVDRPHDEAERYHLSVPGTCALDTSMTLAQNGIGDGAVLVLSRRSASLPAPRYFDVAQAVSATLDAAVQPRSNARHRRAVRFAGAAAAMLLTGVGGLVLVCNAFNANVAHGSATTLIVLASAGSIALAFAAISHRAYRDPTAGLALSMIAIAFAAIAGFVAVPGVPGISNVLLAAAAAGVTSTIAMRVSDCGVVTLTAVSCCAMVIAVAGLAGVISTAPLQIIASVVGLISLGLLGAASRASIALAGLSPRLTAPEVADTEPGDDWVPPKAVRADRWLTSLLAGLSASATVGAVVTVLVGAPHLSCIAFGTLTATLLLLRSRSTDKGRTLVFVVSGIVIVATTFGVSAARTPLHGPWIAAATAMLVTAAMYLGFVAPTKAVSPVVRRSVELLEWLSLAAMVPLTCWICGLYGAVRGMNLT